MSPFGRIACVLSLYYYFFFLFSFSFSPSAAHARYHPRSYSVASVIPHYTCPRREQGGGEERGRAAAHGDSSRSVVAAGARARGQPLARAKRSRDAMLR